MKFFVMALAVAILFHTADARSAELDVATKGEPRLVVASALENALKSSAEDYREKDEKKEIARNGTYFGLAGGAEFLTIKTLDSDVKQRMGILATADLFFLGQEFHSEYSKDYYKAKFTTPALFETESAGYDGGYRLGVGYQRLFFDRKSTPISGDITTYSAMLNLRSDARYMDGLGTVQFELDLPRVDYLLMRQTGNKKYAGLTSVMFGGTSLGQEFNYLKTLETGGRLGYRSYFNFFEGIGCHVGVALPSGDHPEALLKSSPFSDSSSPKSATLIYSFDFRPAYFLTIPIGYLKLQGVYGFSIAEAYTVYGANAALLIVF